jgi:hypothetical protein
VSVPGVLTFDEGLQAATGPSRSPSGAGSRTPLGYCSGCGRSWAGRERCHCPSCHRTVANEAAFDQHIRIGGCG